METPIIKIQNLSCSYSLQKEDTVLYIKDLEIPKGEIVFLLGASGFGKSTLLENLALMNNTIAEGSIIFNNGASQVDYGQLYAKNNLDAISTVRKQHFSFIFQNTNLMENFTAYENICLPRMIQQDVPQKAVMDNAVELMNKVGLPITAVTAETVSVNLSGGQRQRVAFVRALNADFSILFGDEPTGNLDESNANELMKLIVSSLGSERTAIIVSHDINLALNHATRIICITKSQEHGYGEILPQNTFSRKDWQEKNPDDLIAFKEKFRELYAQSTRDTKYSATNTKSANKPEIKNNRHLLSLFFHKEGKALSGKYYSNLLIMSLLLLFTFIALGFANGCIGYITKKLDSAFVEWVPIDIPSGRTQEINKIRDILNLEENKTQFSYPNVTAFFEQQLWFYKKNTKEELPILGRSIEVGATTDPILSDIVSSKNLVKGDASGFKLTSDKHTSKDLSLIVTEELLTKLNHTADDPFLYMDIPMYDSLNKRFDVRVPMAIRAVVKELPGKTQFAFTDYFGKVRLKTLDNAFDIRNKRKLRLFIHGDSALANTIYKALDGYAAATDSKNGYSTFVNSAEKDDDTYLGNSNMSYHIDVKFSPQPTSIATLDSIYNTYVTSNELKKYADKIFRSYDYLGDNYSGDVSGVIQVDAISVNLKELDKIRPFEAFIRNLNKDGEEKSGSQIQLDMTKVKEKEDFNFISRITYIISGLLILFGIVSVVLFIFSLLKMHFSQVKMNIGTFTAFGLSNSKVQMIYFMIMVRFIIISLVAGIALAAVFGKVIDLILKSRGGVDENATYFILNSPVTYISLAIIVVSVILVSYLTIRKMLYKTPGDLIYNR